MNNQSSVKEFLLTGFSNYHEIQILHFVMFLLIYLIALTGNVLLVVLAVLNHSLHSPMYFFLANLTLSDVFLCSTVIPKSMAMTLTNNKLISYAGCVAQVFLVETCGGTELFLLNVMAYDRYVAICHPLQYEQIMNCSYSCIQMAAASWVSNFINELLQTIIAFQWNFCRSNIIEQFFCDISQLQKISCSDTRGSQILILVMCIIVSLVSCGIIFVSYAYIFSSVLKIPVVQGRYKAFSTCTPHLIVFALFQSMALFSYLRSKALSSHTVNSPSTIFYTVLPSLLSPVIYSLRNKDIHKAVWNIAKKGFLF